MLIRWWEESEQDEVDGTNLCHTALYAYTLNVFHVHQPEINFRSSFQKVTTLNQLCALNKTFFVYIPLSCLWFLANKRESRVIL